MPEGTVKWFNAEFAPGDPRATETVAAHADSALVAVLPDVLGDPLTAAGVLGAAVAIGAGAALRTVRLRRGTGRTGRWPWRVALAGGSAAVAASTGGVDQGGHRWNVPDAAVEVA